MLRELICGLLVAGLGFGLPAQADTWSVGVDAGSAKLHSSAGGAGLFDDTIGIRAAYWLTPRFSIEAGVAQTDDFRLGIGPGSGYEFVVHPLRSFELGARGEWPLGEKLFAIGRLGLDYSRYTSTVPVVTAVNVDFTQPSVSTAVEIRHGRRSDVSPYLGLGFGWRWNAHWASSLEASRVFGDYGSVCTGLFPGCLSRSSHLDTTTLTLDYRFD